MKAKTTHMDEPTHAGQRVNAQGKDLRHEYAVLLERVHILEEEKRELQAFAALASHELLEPLVMADAYAQMVLERLPDDDPDPIEDLLALPRGLSRARLIVEALLQETAAPQRRLETKPVDLDAV